MQGTAADIIKKAMLLVDKWIQEEGNGRVKLLMQVHDELVFEVEESSLSEIESKVQNLMIENEIIDGKLIAKENSNKILYGNTFISSIGSLPEPIQGIPMDGSTYNIVDEDSGKFDELEKVHGMGNAITGKGNIKASRVSAKTVGDLTIDLIHDIDQDVIDNIDSKVKEWQSKSSYDGNYFEWKAKK